MFMDMNVGISILEYVNKRRPLTDEEWAAVDAMVGDGLPEFHAFMTVCKATVGLTGYRVCLLLRLSVRVKDIATLLGVSLAYVSKVSTKVLLRLWGEKGSSKELGQKLYTAG